MLIYLQYFIILKPNFLNNLIFSGRNKDLKQLRMTQENFRYYKHISALNKGIHLVE